VDKGMMWSVVGVVLVGLTTIAYKHPASYRRLTLGLIPLLLSLLFASVGWSLGQSSAYQSLAPHLYPARGAVLMASFLDAVEEKSFYDAAMLIVIAYLFFLSFLPHIRARDASSAAEHPDVRQSQSAPS